MANLASTEFLSDVEPPLVVFDPSKVHWDDTADVVIVGFGGAGAAAAIQARELGADVIALDRFNGGGATAYSGGVTYAGATRYQKEAGYEDSADNMYRYLSQEGAPVSPETLRRFCEGSNGDLEWLEAQGVPFNGKAYPEKTTYPPEGFFLYFSGNEKVPSYKKNAAPAPRGHRAVGPGFTGAVHFHALRNAALSKGTRLIPHSPVRRLVTAQDGTVIGVEISQVPESARPQHDALYSGVTPMKPFAGAKQEEAIKRCAIFEREHSERKLVSARGGVILSAGGFVFNLEMVRKHRPVYAKVFRSIMRLGSMGCDGSGIDLGRSAGGATALMDNFYIGRSIAPPVGFVRGVMVDQDGNRFLNEDAYNGFLGKAIGDLPGDGKAWLILDRKAFFASLKQCLFPGKGMYLYTLPSLLNILFGGTRFAFRLNGLAKRCKLQPLSLQRSIQANNQAAASGVDPFGKSPDNIRALTQGPYFAINMDLSNKFTISMLFSLGGLTVNEQTGNVTRPDGTAIRGLYAAGRSAVGLCSTAYMSGMSIADTVFSGRRAAQDAARQKSPVKDKAIA
ncbi:FAD-binding protein [Massilia niabensis]|uniref:FAD-binding protein n=1 Tax=Massilia niabensis TaxID=544910 RepID=A0ABW0LAZ6_9BURK